jgi:hypothetical protein
MTMIEDEILKRKNNRTVLYNVNAIPGSEFTQWASVWFSDVVDIAIVYDDYRNKYMDSWLISNCLPVYSENLLTVVQDFLKTVNQKSVWVINSDDMFLMSPILMNGNSPLMVFPNATENDIPPRVRSKVTKDCSVRLVDDTLYVWQV